MDTINNTYKDELYNMPFNMNTFNKLWGVFTPEEAKAKIECPKKEWVLFEHSGHSPWKNEKSKFVEETIRVFSDGCE